MPVLVKLISQGVGLATEAYASSKKSKAAKTASSPSSASSPAPEPSSPPRRFGDEPPQYAELPNDQATELIASGSAIPVDEAGSARKQEQDPVAAPAVLDDDDVWALDEASEERWHHHQPSTSARVNSSSPSPPGAPVGSEKPDISNNVRIRDLLSRLPPPPPPTGTPRLPCPVILPQRRPREKTRGFVRAYAPVLQDAAGIDQATFLAFLKSFHAASQASPVFNVILLANAAVGFVPSVAVMATTAAVNAVVIPAQIAQQRYRANTFLDEANERLFKPRGLFAMIVAFKGDDGGKPVEAKQLDINAVYAKYGGDSSSGSKWKDGARKMRLSSGKTYGEEGLPVAADLVFPGLEGEDGEEGEQAEGMKGKKKWLADYYDRRAQANFLAENPDSSLIKQKPEFASSWADPSHPAYQGTLVTLVSGGKVPPRQRGVRGLAGVLGGAVSARGGREGQYQSSEGRGGLLGGRGPLAARAGAAGRGREGLLGSRGLLGRGTAQGQEDYYDRRSPSPGYGSTNAYAGEQGYYEDNSRNRQQSSRGGSGVAARGGRTTIIGTVKKALRQDVLYLMIVNLPTDEEMARAQAQLEELQGSD
ncbi:hypothetical protein SLS55_004060 [Diplodia seriata]|uniref:Uncharacterized protein n=1 Tax=Diplodia seriata TaxID=420778 RepID=A0ABR3CIK3_9PEZI